MDDAKDRKICNIIWTDEHDKIEKEILRKSKEIKRRKEKITVSYNRKEDLELAKSIAKDLRVFLYTTEHKKAAIAKKIKCDWRIIICDKKEMPRETEENILYKYCGMSVLKKEHSIYVYVDGGKSISEATRDKLIKEYEEVLSNGLEKKEEAKKRLDKWKEEHKNDPVNCNAMEKLADKISDLFDASLEMIDRLPLLLQIILGIPAAFVELLLVVAGLVFLALPFGISELLFKQTLEGLKSSNFSKKFIRDAQEQIVRVRIFDFFKNERYFQISAADRQKAEFDEIQ